MRGFKAVRLASIDLLQYAANSFHIRDHEMVKLHMVLLKRGQVAQVPLAYDGVSTSNPKLALDDVGGYVTAISTDPNNT